MKTIAIKFIPQSQSDCVIQPRVGARRKPARGVTVASSWSSPEIWLMQRQECRAPRSAALRLFALLAFFLTAFAAAVHAQPTIGISATDANAAETWPGQTPDTGTVRLTRSGSTTGALTINARLRGTAIYLADYTVAPSTGQTLAFDNSVNTTITFPAGQANIDLTIAPVDDVIVEVTKTVRVEISAPNVAGQYLISGNGRAEVTLPTRRCRRTSP
jgi:hypothetical protein